jgi:hypothetical protein
MPDQKKISWLPQKKRFIMHSEAVETAWHIPEWKRLK